MTNRGIASKIKKIIPWWECEGNIYRQTLEILESNDKKLLINLKEFIEDYYNAEKVTQELEKKINSIKN